MSSAIETLTPNRHASLATQTLGNAVPTLGIGTPGSGGNDALTTRRVLRGGSWATRSRMVRNTFRNFFTPDRSDVFAGFRACSPVE